MIGIIGGTVFFKSELFASLKTTPEHTKFGTVYLKKAKGFVFIPRHSANNNIPAHAVNYKANITALKNLGVKEVIGVYSTGSLKKEFEPGSLVVPDDYINFQEPLTFFDLSSKHVLPRLSSELRKKIISSAEKLGLKIKTRATYFQSPGPRLETMAEVNFLKNYADLVGMTMANEATLCRELGLQFAGLCSVDNFANGVADKPLTQELIEEAAAHNSNIASAILAELIG